jgi:CheY-like chemotaxis protein
MALSLSANILIVDDQPISIAVTQSILNRLGFMNVDTSMSAAEAIERIRSRRYDLVLSDWHMPLVDGPEFFRLIKLAAGHKRPKFYFLTGDNRWGCMATARDIGADGLLVKPSRPAELMNRLSQTLALH